MPTWERPVYACYKNLALANRGKLGENLNHFPQGGTEGLWMPWRDTRQQADLLADIFWVQGLHHIHKSWKSKTFRIVR